MMATARAPTAAVCSCADSRRSPDRSATRRISHASTSMPTHTAIARKSGPSVSRAHSGAAVVRSATRPIHSSQSAGASRVLNASRPRSIPTTISDAVAVSASAADATHAGGASLHHRPGEGGGNREQRKDRRKEARRRAPASPPHREMRHRQQVRHERRRQLQGQAAPRGTDGHQCQPDERNASTGA